MRSLLLATLYLYPLFGGPSTVAPTRVVCVGDSITDGSATGVSPTYPAKLASDTGQFVWQGGHGGKTAAQLWSTYWPYEVSGHIFTHVAILAGVNDLRLDGVDAATAYSRLLTYYGWVLSTGAKLAVTTICPCKGEALCTAAVQGYIKTVNSSIGAFAAAHPEVGLADCYATLGGQGGNDPDALDPSFDSGDHLHPNQAGTNALEAIERTALGL